MEPLINGLPTEILQEIWSLVVAASEPPPTSLASEHALWTFGHVCRRWRAAAISHSSMWCTISISEDHTPPIEQLGRKLQLSNNLPLTIVFHQSTSDRCLRLLEALVAYSNQWRRFSLILSENPTPLLKALERARGKVPILQQITLQGFATSTGNPFAFEIAPQLKDVTLRFNPAPIIPWHQLTRLAITSYFAPLVPILQAAQNLIELTVQLIDRQALPSSTTPQICLPLVKHCLLFQSCVIDMLKLPELEVFVVEPGTASAFVSLLHRSSCSLKKLGLYGACSIETVIPMLRACPALVEMTLIGEGPAQAAYLDLFVAELSKRSSLGGDSALAVPQLKRILVMADNLDQDQFVNMVQSRWRVSSPDHRLEQVTAVLTKKWNDTEARRLRGFQSEGLQVRI
ncbi:hypothetical protein B0H14DRAFT_51915 [Mycena olivaceomarginata]|nr:hypothetical protein B0H14DRAFT_51915 [Mycena olivaceomarginata]